MYMYMHIYIYCTGSRSLSLFTSLPLSLSLPLPPSLPPRFTLSHIHTTQKWMMVTGILQMVLYALLLAGFIMKGTAQAIRIICVPYVCVRLICVPYVCASYMCLACVLFMPYMYALYVCLTCMPYSLPCTPYVLMHMPSTSCMYVLYE